MATIINRGPYQYQALIRHKAPPLTKHGQLREGVVALLQKLTNQENVQSEVVQRFALIQFGVGYAS